MSCACLRGLEIQRRAYSPSASSTAAPTASVKPERCCWRRVFCRGNGERVEVNRRRVYRVFLLNSTGAETVKSHICEAQNEAGEVCGVSRWRRTQPGLCLQEMVKVGGTRCSLAWLQIVHDVRRGAEKRPSPSFIFCRQCSSALLSKWWNHNVVMKK